MFLKPWKFKRPFQMQCWKAVDNHVQGVKHVTLGKCPAFQGFKMILQSPTTFLSIVLSSCTLLRGMFLKPWKFKRPFQMQCWKAVDNHVQGVKHVTLGKCPAFQGFKMILQSPTTFLPIVYSSCTKETKSNKRHSFWTSNFGSK